MKAKYLCLAIPVCLLLSLAMSGVASAGEVNTKWDFDGPGEITIHTEKVGDLSSSSHLYVETTGSHSDGYQNVTAEGFQLNRYAYVEDGTIFASFVEDCTICWRPSHAEWGALLTGGGADPRNPDTWEGGSGFMRQSYSCGIHGANFNTYIEAGSPYTVMAEEESTRGDYYGIIGSWNFGIGATGDGDATLDVDLHDTVYNGMHGSFFVGADQTDAGFGASWSTLADFSGTTWTPSITQNFDVDVGSSGSYGEDASASWVTIAGRIDGLK